MRKAILTTTITKIIKDGQVKPSSPYYHFKNDSYSVVKINQLQLNTYTTFSIQIDAVIAACIAKGIAVENDTTFNITFPPSSDQQTYRQSLELIETFIKIVDE